MDVVTCSRSHFIRRDVQVLKMKFTHCSACNTTGDLVHGRCIPCRRKFALDHYYANRSKYLKRNKTRRKALSKFVQQYKIEHSTCTDCKMDHPPWRLQFDHLPGTVKIADVSSSYVFSSIKHLQSEIAKCEIVCGNCHADRTHSRRVRLESN